MLLGILMTKINVFSDETFKMESEEELKKFASSHSLIKIAAMRIVKYLLSISLLIISMISFQSCDEESYDVVGNPDNLIFVKTNYSFDISRSPMGGVESVEGDEICVKIPVFATRPVETEVSVTADFDASLVEKYNTANSVEYNAIDGSLINWSKKTVTFLPGSYVAADSIEFSIPKENCVNLLDETYVIPIRLTDSSDCTLSLNNRYSYTVVNCKFVYLDSDATEMVGTELTDKSSWSISSDDSSADVSKCIDGENSTFASFSVAPTITIDLSTVKNVRSASVYTTGDFWGTLSNLSWSVSSDGEDWTNLCELSYPSTIDNAYSMVLLSAVEARYLRFNVEWSYGSWYGRDLGEINVYVGE